MINPFSPRPLHLRGAFEVTVMAKRTLDDILADMRECATFDEENGHSQADGLLCEAMTLIAPDSERVKEIIEKFIALPKWYA